MGHKNRPQKNKELVKARKGEEVVVGEGDWTAPTIGEMGERELGRRRGRRPGWALGVWALVCLFFS